MFTISADGVDVTSNFAGANMTMTITDAAGWKSDTLQVVLDDLDGMTIAPRTGAVLNPIGGYEGNMRDFGLYAVDSIVYDGWPQKITIDAKSVAAKSAAKQREPKAYPEKDFPTYGDIFLDIAKRIGVQLKISVEIKSKKNTYEAQADENSLEFTTRLGEKLNASVSIKAGNLVVVKKGAGLSVSGGSLGIITISKGFNLLSYSVTEKDEPKHKEVEATWYDRKTNKREIVTVQTGMDGPKFLMRTPFQDEQEAKAAAEAHAQELLRMRGDASFEIDGDPFAMAEAWAVVSGCRTRVDGMWWAKTVTHQFSADAPYRNSIQCAATPEGGD
ncbi:phage late control D family protein [Agrobacterium tumefaciens]|uniref:phage late control D family protein n=1 Tax=Agrobacterium tumefaciens TaxID=358 RepID=UPI00157385C9|nr:contractile injection system protein, VgrG/Pvc8 family [Agrobacterium tumefaciens]NTD85505.1 late control protein D [Agrobacterium tumefaciens]NTD90854.1 late control protein D [Agrobacterium tumefaciens]NTE03676.1 late control protein D [Agrobacterium tumefaciens]NTE15928.1 late control protein D [Agrobacterium tumefaciens]NTE26502.1 late control protein D [Agrobacterium tumefaciens]